MTVVGTEGADHFISLRSDIPWQAERITAWSCECVIAYVGYGNFNVALSSLLLYICLIARWK